MSPRALRTRPDRAQAVRFGLVGLTNVAVYAVLYSVLRLVVPYGWAHVLAYTLAMVASFFLHCLYTYRTRPTWRKFGLFPLGNLASFAVLTAGVWVLVEGLQVDERLAPFLALLISVPVSFVLLRTVLVGRGDPAAALVDDRGHR